MVAEVAEEKKDIKIYLWDELIATCFSATPQMGDVRFKHDLSWPPVFADQLNKTAAAQIDRSDAGAGFFNT